MKILTLICLSLFSLEACSDQERENAILSGIKKELRIVMELIDEAENEKERQEKMNFQYDWLKEDVEKITQGIEDKISKAHLYPRRILEIKGDYIENKRSRE